jgi:uncharacterized protein (DUF2236 family)
MPEAILVAERFCGGVTEDEKPQLFEKHLDWYRMYGMSMRPVPNTWEDNKATRDVLDLAKYPKPPFAQWVPDALWWSLSKPLATFMV